MEEHKTMYCKRCGNFVKENDTKCKACGTLVEDQAEKPATQDEIEIIEEKEFQWDVHDFPKNRKTEDAVFVWDSNSGEEETLELPLEQQLFREVSRDNISNHPEDLDKFLTFSKKNEEFQKLLDNEYERLRSRSDRDYIPGQEAETSEDQENLYEEAEEMTKVVELEEIIKTEVMEETVKAEDLEELPENKKVKQDTQVAEMQAARASFFSNDIIQDNETIIEKYGEGMPITEDRTIEKLEEEKPETEKPETEKSEGEGTAESILENETPNQAIDILEEEGKVDIAALPPGEDQVVEEEKAFTRGRFWKVVLTVIAILLAIEIVILGIQYFLPRSGAAQVIGEGQQKVAAVVTDWIDDINNLFSASDAENNDEPVDPEPIVPDKDLPDDGEKDISEPDPNPAADKDKLVTQQLINNKNISSVKSNSSLSYVEGNDYGLADINKSQAITNNIWFTKENGEAVYYDASIIGTLISFDSQWIDYVNEGDKKVLDLLKKDSKAYNNAVNFSKVGKIKETFKLLELGEIRQSEKGFYAWVHEEIQIEEGGKATDIKYNWIYYLEPDNGQMKIVNYYKF